MSALGGAFQLITNNGIQDELIMATSKLSNIILRIGTQKLQKLQEKRFCKLQKNTLVKSSFYSDYSNAPLNEHPIINKTKHIENFNEINTEGLDKEGAFETAITSEKNRNFEPSYKGFSFKNPCRFIWDI